MTSGVYCLETVWFGHDDKSTVRPMLEMLDALWDVPFIHRDAVTREEFLHYLHAWCDNPNLKRYNMLYLGYHGDSNGIWLNDDDGYPATKKIALQTLTDELQGKCNNRLVHFSSCSTIDTESQDVKDFLELTEASGVSGYKSDVDWMQSTTFDALYVEQLSKSLGARVRLSRNVVQECMKRLTKQPYKDFADSIGFQLKKRRG